MKKIVIASLSRTGLCNRLFIWAEALVFAEKNSLPLYVNGWHKTPIGPWLRNERTKRIYAFYFKNQSNYIAEITRLLLYSKKCSFNPEIQTLNDPGKDTYVFNKMPSPSNYFYSLKNKRLFIKDSLINMISNKTLLKIRHFDKVNKIAVHIRLGDFTTLKINQDQQYFINAINFVRSVLGFNLPVTIFTDGYKYQISEVMKLDNTNISQNNSDIADLFHLSSHKVIITSPGSTFSYWGAFLSDAIIIHPSSYSYTPIARANLKTIDDWKVEYDIL